MRLRRKADEAPDEPGEGAEGDRHAGEDLSTGPFDSADQPDDDRDWVDLGGLRVSPPPGFELRLQVDEQQGDVLAVLLTTDEGAVEVRPFAAPRLDGTWDDTRREIAAETARHGGTATEVDGPFGVELRTAMPVQTPDGQSAYQPARVIGVDGPRWLLRATLLGLPAVEPEGAKRYEDALRNVVVHRGNDAMAPGEPLPLTVPAHAQRLD